MVRRVFKSPLFLLAVIIVGPVLQACSQRGANPASENSQDAAEPHLKEQMARTGFDRDLQFIRNGQFTYVWVFSRQDGKPLDKDDGAYLRHNAPQVIDWVTTDEGKRVIAGTNFDLETGNLPLLRKRFVVEDYTGR